MGMHMHVLQRVLEESGATLEVEVLRAVLVQGDFLGATGDDPKGGAPREQPAHAALGGGHAAAEGEQDVAQQRYLEQDGRLHAAHARIERQPRRHEGGIVLRARAHGAVEAEAARDEPMWMVANHHTLADVPSLGELEHVVGGPQPRAALQPPGLAEHEAAEERRVEAVGRDAERISHDRREEHDHRPRQTRGGHDEQRQRQRADKLAQAPDDGEGQCALRSRQ